jgi:hypothetical protein
MAKLTVPLVAVLGLLVGACEPGTATTSATVTSTAGKRVCFHPEDPKQEDSCGDADEGVAIPPPGACVRLTLTTDGQITGIKTLSRPCRNGRS